MEHQHQHQHAAFACFTCGKDVPLISAMTHIPRCYCEWCLTVLQTEPLCTLNALKVVPPLKICSLFVCGRYSYFGSRRRQAARTGPCQKITTGGAFIDVKLAGEVTHALQPATGQGQAISNIASGLQCALCTSHIGAWPPGQGVCCLWCKEIRTQHHAPSHSHQPV